MRRTIRFAAALLPLMLTAGTGAAHGQALAVAGKVFLDANGNGRLDPGEKGIAGVRVTDGVSFVETAEDGSYKIRMGEDPALPHKFSQTVAVSWPTGKWPTGSWWVRLSEIKDADAMNFGLREDVQKLPFAFGHVSDDHGSLKNVDVQEVGRSASCVKLMFNTGDTTVTTDKDGKRPGFWHLVESEKKFGVPFFNAPGNHDYLDHGTTDPDVAKWGAWTKDVGPVRWSFDYAGVHFVGVDDGQPAVCVAWLEKDLQAVRPGTRIMMMSHIPYNDHGYFQVMAKYKVTYVCAGHTHQAGYARWGGTPSHTNFSLGLGILTAESFDMVETIPFWEDRNKWAYFNGAEGYFDDLLCAALLKRRLKQQALTQKTLADATQTLAGGQARAAEIILQLDPGSAKRAGLRVGDKQTLEIAFTDGRLEVAGAPVPLPFSRKDKLLKLHLLVDDDVTTITVQEWFDFFKRDVTRLRMPKLVKVDAPSKVTAFAEGGVATFKQLEVWEIRRLDDRKTRMVCHFPTIGFKWGGELWKAIMAGEADKTPATRKMLEGLPDDGIAVHH